MTNIWHGSGVLVTGASGFVGGWLANALVDKGARVIALVRDHDPSAMAVHEELWRRAVRIQGDLIDTDLIRRAIAEHQVSTVFHLAAQASVQSALSDPVGTFESNVKGTWSLLEACRATGVDRIVVASSDKAYGDQPDLPYREDSPLLGRYPYDASKAAADIITFSYHRTYGLPVVVTRNANTYGGGDLSGHRLVPEVVHAVLKGRRPVIRSDGTPERDYLYVKDAVSGYLKLAERLSESHEGVAGEAFNLGTGVPVSVMDLVRMVLKVAGSDLEPDVRGTATKEISRQFLSSEKARDVLGWEPQYSLEDGLRETIDWYRSRPELLRSWTSG